MYLIDLTGISKNTILFTFSNLEKIQKKMYFVFLYMKGYLSTTHKPCCNNVSTTYPQPDLPIYPQLKKYLSLIHRLIHNQPQPKNLSTDLSTDYKKLSTTQLQ